MCALTSPPRERRLNVTCDIDIQGVCPPLARRVRRVCVVLVRMVTYQQKVRRWFIAWIVSSVALVCLNVFYHWPMWASVISIFVFNVVCGILFVRYASSIRRANERSGNRTCRRCGYDLGTEIARCPECGTMFDPDEPIL